MAAGIEAGGPPPIAQVGGGRETGRRLICEQDASRPRVFRCCVILFHMSTYAAVPLVHVDVCAAKGAAMRELEG